MMVRKEISKRKLPGGPVIKMSHFHCRGAWVRSLVEELILCVTQHGQKIGGGKKKGSFLKRFENQSL